MKLGSLEVLVSEARQGKSRWVKVDQTSDEKSKQGAWHGKSPSMETWHGEDQVGDLARKVGEGSIARSPDCGQRGLGSSFSGPFRV